MQANERNKQQRRITEEEIRQKVETIEKYCGHATYVVHESKAA